MNLDENKASMKKAVKSTGCNSASEFALRAGITRPALYRAFNNSPHKFNEHFNCAKYYRASANLKLAEADLRLAQKAFNKMSKYKGEVLS